MVLPTLRVVLSVMVENSLIQTSFGHDFMFT